MQKLKSHIGNQSMRAILFSLLILLVLSSVFLPGCEEKIVAPETSRSLEVKIRPGFRSSALASSITKYIVIVSGEGMTSITVDLKLVDGLVVGRVNDIPIGPARLFTLQGLDVFGVVLYSGESSMDILPGSIATVDVPLVPVAPLLRMTPSLDSLLVPGSLGDTVSVRLFIHNATGLSALNWQVLFPKNLVVASIQPSPLLPRGALMQTFDSTIGIIGSVFSGNGMIVDSLGNAELAVLRFTRVSRSSVFDSAAITPVVTGFTGNDTISQIYTDDALIRLPGVTLVNPQNNPPVWEPIPDTSVSVGSQLRLSVIATDPDGTDLTLSATILRNATFNPTGPGRADFLFTPEANQAGVHEVVFIVSDSLLTDTEVVSITVLDVNHDPVWDPVPPQTVAEGDSLLIDVIARDIDGDPLRLNSLTLTANAVFASSGGGKGRIIFVPDFEQEGNYTFRLVASDSVVTPPAAGPLSADTLEIQVSVINVDRPPVWGPVDTQFVSEGALLVVDVLATDPDLGDTNSFNLTALSLPSGASFSSSTGGDGVVRFSPDFTQAGIYDVVLDAQVRALRDTLTFTIIVNNINRAPLFDPIPDTTVSSGRNLSLVVSAVDLDGDSLVFSATGIPTGASLANNFDGTATFSWTPDSTEIGPHNVTFRVTDGSVTVGQSVTVTVGPAVTPNVITVESKVVTAGDSFQLIVRLSNSVELKGGTIGLNWQDIDLFLDSVSYVGGILQSTGDFIISDSIDNDVNHEVLIEFAKIAAPFVLPGDSVFATLWFNVDSAAQAKSVAFSSGTISQQEDFFLINANNNVFAPLFVGGSVTISALQVNAPPVLDPILNAVVSEGETLSIAVSATDSDSPVLTLSASTLANAFFVDNGDGTGVFSFTPGFSQAGVSVVTIIATDGVLSDTAVVSITVLNTNRGPVWNPAQSQAVSEGDTLSVIVSASDADGDSLQLSEMTLPANSGFVDNGDGTGVVTFAPDFTQAGSYIVTLEASDGALTDTLDVQITVGNVNRTPVIEPIALQSVVAGELLNISVFAFDPDGTTPALSASGIPAGAVFTDNLQGFGSFQWTPDASQVGNHSVTFFASDGALIDSEVVVISVTGNADPGIRDSVIVQGAQVSGGSHFPIIVRMFNDETLTAGDVNLFWQDQDLVLDSVSFIGSVIQAVPEIAKLVEIDTIGLGGVAITFIKSGPPQIPPGSGVFATLWFSVASTSSGKSITIDANAIGVDDDIVFLGSNSVLFAPVFVPGVVTIVPPTGNVPPILSPIGAQSVTEGSQLSFVVLASDANGTIPEIVAVGLPPLANFQDNLDGTAVFDWIPGANQSGSYDVTFIASDGIAADSEVVTITVNNLGNSLPTIQPIAPKFVTVPDTLVFVVQAFDAETVPVVSISNSSLPQSFFFNDNGDGSGTFGWVPTINDIGNHFVTFEADDKNGGLASQSMSITVRDACGLSLQADFDSDKAGFLPDSEVLRLNYNALLELSVPVGDSILVRNAFGTQPVELKDSLISVGQGNANPSMTLIPDTTMDCPSEILVWGVTVVDTLDKASRIDIRGEGGVVIGSVTYLKGGVLSYNDGAGIIPVSYAPGSNLDDQLLYIAELDFVEQVVRLRVIRSDGSSADQSYPFLNSANRFHALQFTAKAGGQQTSTSLYVDDVIIVGQK